MRRLLGRMVLTACVSASLCGCASTLVPPRVPAEPARVLVLDHGYHSSLVLATGDRVTRYAYGDWRYFALGRRGWINGSRALFRPTRGALGRRVLNVPPRVAALEPLVPTIQASHCLMVEQTSVAALQQRLDARFDGGRAEQVRAPRFGLSFVPDRHDYSLFYNSNHAVARWLGELGVEVRGWPVYARWRRDSAARACPAPDT